MRANSWPSARDCASSFSWCGKTRSSPPPWISNAGPSSSSAITEHSMCQPGRPRPHGRVPPRVLARLVRLPEREVARILLARVRLLLLHLVRPLARELAVVGVARGRGSRRRRRPRTRSRARRARSMNATMLGIDLARLRQVVGPAEAERVRVLEVPLRRARGELGARVRRRLVDLVVDVGDVVDERGVVAARAEPVPQPHADDVGPRVARRARARRRSGRRSTSGSGPARAAAPASCA